MIASYELDKYNKYRSLMNDPEFVLTKEQHLDYLELCDKLLDVILSDNADVLKRLKDR